MLVTGVESGSSTSTPLMTTVLIVEDDPINLRVFIKILTKRGGFDVLSTEDVQEVLNFASEKKMDVVLMDVSLAHSFYDGKPVDGLNITQLLKSNPDTSGIPIILVTAHAMQGDRENFLKQSGADDYISKPVIDHQGFVDKIKQVVEKASG